MICDSLSTFPSVPAPVPMQLCVHLSVCSSWCFSHFRLSLSLCLLRSPPISVPLILSLTSHLPLSDVALCRKHCLSQSWWAAAPLPPTQAPLIWGRRKSKWWEKKIKTKLVTEEGKLRNSRMPSKFLFAKLLCACTCICKRSWALRTDLHFLCDFCIELEGAEPQWAEPQMAATPVALRVLY